MPSAGSKLGPYEILSAIGAGGMGEVYRARDSRIGREVAIKVLPAQFSQDSERLRRFEQEARATGALNHPNIVAVFDIGTSNDSPYLVSEFLQGDTLRRRIAQGVLPLRKTVDFALQIVSGLSAAHDKGIVHRDLKPENIFVTKEGRIKILDFGLAKLAHPEVSDSNITAAATMSHQTDSGVVLGTVLYMSPEQVRGLKLDHRSDIFAFGTILYEMLSGIRPFHGESQVEAMHAILKTDPTPVTQHNSDIPPALERIVQRCLEKDPDHRFQSTSDLAFALESVSLSSSSKTSAIADEKPGKLRGYLMLTLAALAITSAIFYAGMKFGPKFLHASNPSEASYEWTRLTFRRGLVTYSMFAPDAQTVIYSAQSGGNIGGSNPIPSEIFFTRIGSPESRSLGLKHVKLLSVSRTGQLAILLSDKTSGTLATVPFTGGAPRVIAENVRFADWSPDGKNLLILRNHRLEYPVGKVLYAKEFLFSPRFSPKGDLIAFIEVHEGGVGNIQTIDLSGKVQHLCSVDMGRSNSIPRLAWNKSGDEIWFAARSKNGISKTLYSVNLSKHVRTVLPLNGDFRINDISQDGRVLLTHGAQSGTMIYYPPDQKSQIDLSWLDNSQVSDISEDGKTILFSESGDAAAEKDTVYLRNVDADAPVRLGEGVALGLSPDQKWAIAVKVGSLTIIPTGPGESKTIRFGHISWADWFPDGKRILFEGQGEKDNDDRIYTYQLDSGAIQPVSEEGVYLLSWSGKGISPDGKRVIAQAEEGYILYSLEDSKHTLISGLEPNDIPMRWSQDGKSIFVDGGDVYRIDLSTGQRKLWKVITPSDRAGLHGSGPVITGDGKTVVCTFIRTLNTLYLIQGLK